MKLQKLTSSQEKILEETKQEWLDKLFDSEKRAYFNEKDCIKGIKWLYKTCSLKDPIIIIVDSPLACQYVIEYFKLLTKRSIEPQVWSQVESQVRSQVSSQVWSQVESQVSSQVWSQVWSQVGSQVSSQVSSQVESQVSSQVESQVSSQVRTQVRSQVRTQVRSQVWSQVWIQVRTQVSSQVESQKLTYYPICQFLGIWYYSWYSFYETFKKLNLIKNENYDELVNLQNSGIHNCITLDGLCVVSKKPNIIKRKGEKLHSDNSPAIEWKDGYKLFFWNGVCVPEKWIINKDQITSQDIAQESNAEKRRVLMEILGAKKYYDIWSNGNVLKIVDEGIDLQGFPMVLYETMMVDEISNTKVQFLEVTDPSTGRVYNLFPPKQNATNVWEAKSQTFNDEQLFVRQGDVGLVNLNKQVKQPILET